jgi:hypothetical protein
VQPDEDVFRANAKRFTETTGVEVKVDFVGWEDINQQTAVTANSGAGPDIIIGFTDAPHIYVEKIIELNDLADYLGKRYGGWMFLAEKYGKRHKTNNWIGLPFGSASGPLVYRKSIIQAAGFERVPDDHASYPDAVSEAESGRQARGLCAWQCGGRRQRLCKLAVVVAWRAIAGRGRQPRHQQQGDSDGAEISEGAVCALVDGATRLQILWRITLPLAVPGLISAGIFSFTLSWNEFIYSLAFIQSSANKTVPVAILTELVSGDVYQWGALMAGSLLGSLPVAIFYSLFVDYYVSSLTGAVKE